MKDGGHPGAQDLIDPVFIGVYTGNSLFQKHYCQEALGFGSKDCRKGNDRHTGTDSQKSEVGEAIHPFSKTVRQG